MQDRTIQHCKIQYNTITHITQNNIQHSRQPSIRKITKKKIQKHILYTIKTQKRVEPEVDESVLKTTRYTKKWVNHTVQYSIIHISSEPTLQSTSLHLYILHMPPRLNSLTFTAFSWSLPYSKLIFTPLQLIFIPLQADLHPTSSLSSPHFKLIFTQFQLIFALLQADLHPTSSWSSPHFKLIFT